MMMGISPQQGKESAIKRSQLSYPSFLLTTASVSAAAGWGDAPVDLLWKIIEHLPIADYIRFGAVCMPWGAALSEKRCLPAPQAPFVLLGDKRRTGNAVTFLSFSDNKKHNFQLPEKNPSHKFIGSSGGWLVTLVNKSFELHLFNPFSASTHLRLPSVVTLPNVASFYITQALAIGSMDLLSWDHMPHDHFRKLVVSSTSPPMAALICNDSHCLAIATVGGNSWTTIEFKYKARITDILFYQNQLYVMIHVGNLGVYDLSDVSIRRATVQVLPPIECFNRDFQIPTHIYLVATSGGDLLVVWRWIELRDLLMRTTIFRIFKIVGVEKKSCVEVESLGEDVLFLGHAAGVSSSLSAKDFPELRRNCIYVTDNHHDYDNGYSKCDLGVYSMEDKSFKPCNIACEYQTTRPPVWFPPIGTAAPQQQ